MRTELQIRQRRSTLMREIARQRMRVAVLLAQPASPQNKRCLTLANKMLTRHEREVDALDRSPKVRRP